MVDIKDGHDVCLRGRSSCLFCEHERVEGSCRSCDYASRFGDSGAGASAGGSQRGHGRGAQDHQLLGDGACRLEAVRQHVFVYPFVLFIHLGVFQRAYVFKFICGVDTR